MHWANPIECKQEQKTKTKKVGHKMKKWIFIGASAVLFVVAWIVYIENTSSGVKATIEGLLESEYKPHYTMTESDNYEKLWNGKYRYTFKAYDEKGKEQEIIRVIDRTLRADAYLRIYAEGSLGKYWEEVQENEVPVEVLSKMNR